MAISGSITDRLVGSQLPSVSHTPTAVTPLTGTKFSAKFSHKISATGNTDADPEIAYDNFEADLLTWVTGTFLPSTVKLDAAQSITAVVYVDQFKPEEADLTDADPEYQFDGVVEWK